MGSTFNPQILIEKLAKLNSSAQSIETLSHWCIFHMHKAKQVVETWDRQFHCSPRDQRLAYLYLANDILQNSRRKGSEFVSEFWKVLPDSLRDVTKNGDEYAKNSALRLISIWDERKVFGSRGQILKEEFVPRSTRNGKATGIKLRPGAKNALEKIVSGYQVVYSNLTDEDAIIKKCRSAISYIEKVDKESVNTVDEIKEQHDVLRECIDQLSVVETSRANLVSLLREALSEQEYKLELVRNQLQEAQAQSEETDNILRHLTNNTMMTSAPPQTYHKNNEQSLPVMYAKQVSFAEQCGPGLDEDHKSKAAAVAAKLTASTSSAEMLSFLSSLASEGVIGNALKEDYPPEKRARLDNNNNHHQYLYAHTEPSQNNVHEELGINEQPPPPPNSPPPMAPLPPMQPYVVGPGPVPAPAQYTYGYGAIMQQQQGGYYGMNGGQYVAGPPPPPPGNVYQSYPPEGGFYNQASSLPMAPISRE